MSKQWNATRMASGIKTIREMLDHIPVKSIEGVMEVLDFVYQEMENDGEASIIASGLGDWQPRYRKED